MNTIRFARVVTYGSAVLVSAVALFPFLYAVATSLKHGADVFSPNLWPSDATLANYVALFRGPQPFGRQLLNSLMVSTLVVAGSLFLGVNAAYALGRIDFRGRGLLLMTVLSVSMFPQVAVLTGMFELLQALGLYNRAVGLVLPYLIFTLPFTVWVLTAFMRQLPKEIEEAAIMDGCTPAQVVWRIFLPLLWPALVSTTLLAFIHAWNEFLFALTFIASDNERTVPVGISLISGDNAYEVPWASIMAASVTVTVPLIVLVIVFQRKLVSGLTAGAVKG